MRILPIPGNPQIVNLEAESMECLLALRDSESGNVAFAILYWCVCPTPTSSIDDNVAIQPLSNVHSSIQMSVQSTQEEHKTCASPQDAQPPTTAEQAGYLLLYILAFDTRSICLGLLSPR
jgi:hypothetical protein